MHQFLQIMFERTHNKFQHSLRTAPLPPPLLRSQRHVTSNAVNLNWTTTLNLLHTQLIDQASLFERQDSYTIKTRRPPKNNSGCPPTRKFSIESSGLLCFYFTALHDSQYLRLWRLMNYNGSGRKLTWFNISSIPEFFFLQSPRKTTKNLSRSSPYPSRNSNQTSPNQIQKSDRPVTDFELLRTETV
jgi:hypothetical protein